MRLHSTDCLSNPVAEVIVANLRREVVENPIPCGTRRVTSYFDESGKVVRQDVEIIVDPELIPKLIAEQGEK